MAVLYADEDLLLAEKPVGAVSQQDGTDGCFPKQLEAMGFCVKPVHRLDRETGGVMAYGLSDKGTAGLSALVSDHQRFQKEYLAVVKGAPSPLTGNMEDLLYHDVRKNKSYVVKRERKGVRRASLSYETVETAGEYSLVRVRLYTGRTHQIRVQFASRKMPLWGDRRYGGTEKGTVALWSCRLSFPHPCHPGKTVIGESVPPGDILPWSLFLSIKKAT